MRTSDNSSGRVLVVLGPTASGKSSLALDVAEEFEGTVINADSMQLYRDLRVLTARPDPEEEARVPHRLYGVLDGADSCSAHRWRDMATAEIREALAAGRLPVLVGGTGFYIKAMLEGLSPMPEVPDSVRASVRERLTECGALILHEELTEIDPVVARKLEPMDGQRIARALEVYEASGTPLSEWQAKPASGPPEGLEFFPIVLLPDRKVLVERCERRFEQMIERGALEEVRALLDRGLPEDAPVMKAVGVPELARFINGDSTLEESVEKANIATRRYAKRQVTWLRRQIVSKLTVNEQYSKRSMDAVFSFIRKNGLTA